MENIFKDVFLKHGFKVGRMICSSKPIYRNTYPENKFYFNANVISEKEGKVWYGDLDLTLDSKKLQLICNELKENLYVLVEYDCREDKEKLPTAELISKAVHKFEPQ